MPVISSPTRSRYSSNIMSRSASRIRCRITCLAVCAAIRPKSCGVTSSVSIWSSYSLSFSRSISGSGGSRISPVSGSTVGCCSVRRLDQQLLLELRRDLQLPDLEVAAVAVHLDLRVAGRPGRLLVRRQQRVLERLHQLLAGDVLLGGEAAYGLDDLSRHGFSLRDEVGAGDLLVGDRDDAVAGGDRHVLSRGADQLAGHALVPVRAPSPQAHARAPAEEAACSAAAWSAAGPARARRPRASSGRGSR